MPSLVLLNQTADGTMTTTELSARLRTLLNPTGDVMVHRRDPWLTVESLADTLRVTYAYA